MTEVVGAYGLVQAVHPHVETSIETFTYVLSDGDGGTDVATVTVTVNPGNDALQSHLFAENYEY